MGNWSKYQAEVKLKTSKNFDEACYENIMALLKRKRQLLNFDNHRKKVYNQMDIIANKYKKRDVFTEIGKKLINVGGGNIRNLSCAGT